MHAKFRTITLFTAAAFALACSDAAPTGSAGADAAAARERGKALGHGITVMTRNMYIGTDVDPLIAALLSPDPTDDQPALIAAVTTLQETDFPARVQAMADEIADARADVVGLQECDDILVDLRAFGLPVDIEEHFLASLQAELAKRGLHYVVAGQLLSVSAVPLPGISVQDHDVILVNADRVTVDPGVVTQVYQYNVGELAPGIVFSRGYVKIGATIGGTHVTIANTHFQTGDGDQLTALRAAQATELAGAMAQASPAIVLGDFNDVPASPMHQVMEGSGLTDVWAAVHPNQAGLTCCELADLSNPKPAFDQRIDYVWERGFGEGPKNELGLIFLVGDKQGDRVQGPNFLIWPSDHAAVVARMPAIGRDLADWTR